LQQWSFCPYFLIKPSQSAAAPLDGGYTILPTSSNESQNALSKEIGSFPLNIDTFFYFALLGLWPMISPDPMVALFKRVLELIYAKPPFVQTAFYGGYFTWALPAAFFIKK